MINYAYVNLVLIMKSKNIVKASSASFMALISGLIKDVYVILLLIKT